MSQLSGEREIEGNSSAQGTGVTTELVMLKEALMCEKAAPEILPFKQELISRISFYLDRTEEEISSLETDGALEVMRSLYQYEESRIKYMLRSYYRVRLMKIEQFVMAILDDDSMLEKLSRHERLGTRLCSPVDSLRAIHSLRVAAGSLLRGTSWPWAGT